MAENERVAPDPSAMSVVTFFLGDEECAVPITDVYQIIRDVPITRVPNVERHVEGVLNLRGMVVPIIDLKHLLGLGARVESEDHRLLIVEQESRRVGFSADSVGGLLAFTSAELQAAPEVVLARVNGQYISGVIHKDGRIVILLDLAEVLRGRKPASAQETTGGVASVASPRTRDMKREEAKK